MKALGIDPGTSSFDIFCIDDMDKIVLEESVPTSIVVKKPEVLFKIVEKAKPDVMVGPSAMGIPCKHISQMSDEDIAFATLAKNTEVDIAIRRFIRMLKEFKYNAYFIPGVIQLPTIPLYRKTNRIDMGTADKTCIAALAILDHSREWKVNFSDANIIVVELGFGFNAVMAIEKGKIVDGIGGTVFPGPGFLTIGTMDLELSHILGHFSEEQLCFGGVSYIASDGIMTPEEFAKKIGGEERFSIALKTLVEGVIKAVAMELSILNAKPKEILFSGRLCRVNTIYESLIESIETRLDISTRRIRGFSSSTKEAAQGAALIANGLGKGVYKSLIDTMMLKKAKGTVLDYIYWPSFKIKDIMASKIKAMKT